MGVQLVPVHQLTEVLVLSNEQTPFGLGGLEQFGIGRLRELLRRVRDVTGLLAQPRHQIGSNVFIGKQLQHDRAGYW